MWFSNLMGFTEDNPKQVKTNIEIIGNKIISKVNQAEYVYGRLEITSLEELRLINNTLETDNTKISISEIIGDIQTLHKNQENNGALFQVASQFNLLEMASPSITPERGVGIYEGDHTQGPACAVACGAGTIYRNYFVPVNGQIGQTVNNQINSLEELEKAIWIDNEPLWKMQNGYLFTTLQNLKKISNQIDKMTLEEYEILKGKLKIGVQWNTEVTLDNTDNIVSQIYCSALPVSYNNIDNPDEWESFARLILEATYEATFYTALQNFVKTGNNKLFLTLVGGGVFGNKKEWILDAIKKSILKFLNTPLNVKIVSYHSKDPDIRRLMKEIEF